MHLYVCPQCQMHAVKSLIISSDLSRDYETQVSIQVVLQWHLQCDAKVLKYLLFNYYLGWSNIPPSSSTRRYIY